MVSGFTPLGKEFVGAQKGFPQGDHGIYDILHGRVDGDLPFLAMYLRTGRYVAVRGLENRIGVDGDVAAQCFFGCGFYGAVVKG